MNLFRRIPLSRLIVLCAVAVIAVTGVAVAASAGGGGKPRPKSLALAVHDALAAPPIAGVSAKISVTNSLIAGAGLALGGQPLLKGGSGRLWASTDGRVRVELQSDGGDSELYIDHGAVSYYEPSSQTLYQLKLPKSHPQASEPTSTHPLPTVADIQAKLQGLMAHAGVSGAQPSNVGGQPAYRVKLTPHDGGLVAGVALWWDAVHGVPLSFAVYAVGQSSPVLQLTATDVSYTVDPGAFAVRVHPAKTVALSLPVSPGAASHRAGAAHHHPRAASAKALSAALGLAVTPRAKLAGLPLTGSDLVYLGDQPAALLRYGSGLGGIAVLEQRAHADPTARTKPSPSGANGDAQSQSLPTTKIAGSPGTVLATPLGTLVRFSHGALTYTLLGSVRAHTALTAARELSAP